MLAAFFFFFFFVKTLFVVLSLFTDVLVDLFFSVFFADELAQ
jgi:hypothetical protein